MSNTETLQKWAIDPTHTEVQIKVKHLVISTVTGSFKEFSGDVQSQEDDFDGAEINFTIDAASIDTNNPDRDAHLRSDDFFGVEKYPEIKFTDGELKKVSDGDYKLTGNLTIKEETKEVTLDVDYGGTVKDPWGNNRAGFEIEGKINRKDFGLTWNTVTEAGGLMVSDDVRLLINVQVVAEG
ncbi:MAG: YceI family protein [Balneolales bacterium]